MKPSVTAYSSYHDLLRPEAPRAALAYSKPDVSSYAAFDPNSVSGILPAYLSEDLTAKAEAYAEWDPTSAPSAPAYASHIDAYASASHLIIPVAAEAYSQPSSEPSPTSSTATAPKTTTAETLAPILKKERPKAKYRDWNEEFQTLLEKHDQCGDDLEAATPHTLALQKLVTDFTSEAQATASVIISELDLPLEKKTIRPIDAGGIAGGIKFLVKDIFFKVACDEMGLYGDDQYAQKAALLEFSGLLSLLHVRLNAIQGFHLPLMCILSMRGRTLTASSVLPIESGGTLIYGSRDAGKTVLASDPQVNKLMERIAEKLNIKGHYCGVDQKNMTFLHMPVDIEVHRGLDGRIYVLDTARIYPPVTIDRRRRASHLYRLMRAEFVRSYSKPLSSDAFSRMAIHPTAADNNLEVKEATSYLHEKTLGHAIARIKSKLDLSKYAMPTAKRLVMLLHQHGVNLRLLGNLRRATNDEHAKKFIIHEMVARTLKNLYFVRLREMRPVDDEALRSCTAAYLNDAFADDEAGKKFWQEKVWDKLQVDYDHFPTEEDALTIYKSLDLDAIFSRVQSLIAATVTHPITVTNMSAYVTGRPFAAADVEAVEMRVKWMYIFALWEGFALVTQAQKREGDEAERLRLQAAGKYRSALSVFPGDRHAFTSYGLALMLIADVALSRNDPKASFELLEMSRDQFECAVFDAKDSQSYLPLRYWSLALKNSAQQSTDLETKWHLFQEGDEKASLSVASIKRLPNVHVTELYHALDNHALLLFRYAEHLCIAGRVQDAAPLWKRAHEKFRETIAAYSEGSGASYGNAAIAYEAQAMYATGEEQAELYRLAEEAYDKGSKVRMSEDDLAGHYYMWGAYCLHRGARNPEVLEKALQKFEESVKHRQVFYKAWHGWGRALLHKASMTPPAQRSTVLLNALTKAQTSIKCFPTFSLGKLLEGDILMELTSVQSQQENTERYRRLLAIGEELTARGFANDPQAWTFLATGAFRLSQRTADVQLMRKASHAYKKQLQLHAGFPDNFTWKDGLTSPNVGIRNATVQMLLRVTTNPEEQLAVTAQGCVDAIVAEYRSFLFDGNTRVGVANIIMNCAVNQAARQVLQQNTALAKALVEAIIHTKDAPVADQELIPWLHCTYGALSCLSSNPAFAAACLPASTKDNLDARADVAERFFNDLETILRKGGATEGDLIAEFLENIAKNGHQDALLSAQWVNGLYLQWFVNNGSVRIDWAVGPLVRQSDTWFRVVAHEVIAILADRKSSNGMCQVSLRLMQALLANGTTDANVEWFIKQGGARALCNGVLANAGVAIAVIDTLISRGIALSELRAAGTDTALVYLIQHNKATNDTPAKALKTLRQATDNDGGDTLPRRVFCALSEDVCTFAATGESHTVQFYWTCITCKFAPGTCVCSSCARTCHAGHELGPAYYDSAYCDCPAELKEKCVAPKKINLTKL